jgi:hypothetical protein
LLACLLANLLSRAWISVCRQSSRSVFLPCLFEA